MAVGTEPAGWQFKITIQVADDAIDEMDHVNNAVYLQYVETIARAHSDAAGYTSEALFAEGGVFVVRSHNIVYYGSALRGDVLTVRTRVEQMKGPRALREVHIFRGDERLVEAHTEWVYIDPVSRTPKRIPPEMIGRFIEAGRERA